MLLLKSTPFYTDSPKLTPIRATTRTPVSAPVYYKTLHFAFLWMLHFIRAHNDLTYIYYTLTTAPYHIFFYTDTSQLYCKPITSTRVHARTHARVPAWAPAFWDTPKSYRSLVYYKQQIIWKQSHMEWGVQIYLLFGTKCNLATSFTF